MYLLKLNTLLEKLTINKRHYFLLTSVLFVLFILPRFNGNQLIIKQEPYDSKYFKSYVEYFRAEPLTNELRPATNWRFLVPLIASYLPVSALTAINLINALSLALGLWVFFKTMQLVGIDTLQCWQSLWLFIVSFPMFYYSSIGYVDAALFIFIAISIYATFNHKPFLFSIAILTGLCVKESIAIAIPFYLFYHYKNNKKSAFTTTLITCLLYAIIFFTIKKYAPISAEITRNNFWKFNINNASINLYRANTWLSFILSFGAAGLLSARQLLNQSFSQILNNNIYMACLACIGCAIILYVLSYFSTIADGRIIWISYFYMLLISFVKPKVSSR